VKRAVNVTSFPLLNFNGSVIVTDETLVVEVYVNASDTVLFNDFDGSRRITEWDVFADPAETTSSRSLRRLEVPHGRVAEKARQLLLIVDAEFEPVDEHPGRDVTFVTAFVARTLFAPVKQDTIQYLHGIRGQRFSWPVGFRHIAPPVALNLSVAGRCAIAREQHWRPNGLGLRKASEHGSRRTRRWPPISLWLITKAIRPANLTVIPI
jgi:hypothetical protein